MAITINSNISALNAERRLAGTTAGLQASFERLSSGLRINRAKDDAAGLAIAESLNVDARVLSRGARNVNDAISMINIAEGAVSELSSIVIRIEELSEAAANGTLSSVQREALNEEAQALSDEYARIVATTEFNGITLLDGSISTLRVQSGYSTQDLEQGEALTDRVIPAGTFEQEALSSALADTTTIFVADVNGDGIDDAIRGNQDSDVLSIFLAQGDGTFSISETFALFAASGSAAFVDTGDINNDGHVDIVVQENMGLGDRAKILLNDGDGTFTLSGDATIAQGFRDVELGDINNDGNLDMFVTWSNTNAIGYRLGNGDGTFGGLIDLGGTSGGQDPVSLELADFNADGNLDVAVGSIGGGARRIRVRLGGGDGTFAPHTDYLSGDFHQEIKSADINNDGAVDIVSSSDGVLLNDGDGTFTATTSRNIGDDLELIDVDQDGSVDLIDVQGGFLGISFGRGDGTFEDRVAFTNSGSVTDVAVGDFNGDGAIDLLGTRNDAFGLLALLQDAETVGGLPRVDLTTVSGARSALETMKDVRETLTSKLGIYGAAQSRLDVSARLLSVSAQNYTEAESRIRDVDIAEESSALLRREILQNAGASVLAQANQQPALALSLLQQI